MTQFSVTNWDRVPNFPNSEVLPPSAAKRVRAEVWNSEGITEDLKDDFLSKSS